MNKLIEIQESNNYKVPKVMRAKRSNRARKVFNETVNMGNHLQYELSPKGLDMTEKQRKVLVRNFAFISAQKIQELKNDIRYL